MVECFDPRPCARGDFHRPGSATIRGWHKLFEQRGIEGLTSFEMGGSAKPDF
jgi:hypothetical protein